MIDPQRLGARFCCRRYSCRRAHKRRHRETRQDERAQSSTTFQCISKAGYDAARTTPSPAAQCLALLERVSHSGGESKEKREMGGFYFGKLHLIRSTLISIWLSLLLHLLPTHRGPCSIAVLLLIASSPERRFNSRARIQFDEAPGELLPT